MTDRVTKSTLETRVDNLNRRMESRGSIYRYAVQGRNSYTALDRMTREGATDSLVILGTKREIADYLHLMMVVLDDAAMTS